MPKNIKCKKCGSSNIFVGIDYENANEKDEWVTSLTIFCNDCDNKDEEDLD